MGCKHTGCKSCYGQDLELGGFTMPLLGKPSFKGITFYNKLYELTNLVLTLVSMYFQV